MGRVEVCAADGKWTKVPYQPHRRKWRAKADVPSTWSTSRMPGGPIGPAGSTGSVRFAADDPYFGVDLDDCLRDAGVMAWARPYVAAMSPSFGGDLRRPAGA